MRNYWERMTRTVVHAAEQATGLVHAVYTFKIDDVSHVIKDAQAGRWQGMRRGCDREPAEMQWTSGYVTCLACAAETP